MIRSAKLSVLMAAPPCPTIYLPSERAQHPACRVYPEKTWKGYLSLKRLSDALRIKAYLKETACRKAIIIGAGFIAMEVCEAFVTRGIATEIIHRGKLPVNRWDPVFYPLIKVPIAKCELVG